MSDIVWMPMKEAMQVLIGLNIISKRALKEERDNNNFAQRYPNIPALPHSTYNYNEFWKDIRLKCGKLDRRDINWMSLDTALNFCIKHNLTSAGQLALFKNNSVEYVRVPVRAPLVYKCPDFFKRVRKSLGIVSRFDKEWMTKEEAISYCIEHKIHSGLRLRTLSKEGKIDKMRMPCHPDGVYADSKFWIKVRKSLGMIAPGDKVWMDPEDAIAIFSAAGVTSKQKALANKHLFKLHPNLPMRPKSVYNDKDFWKKVRNDPSELRRNFVVPDNFSERYPDMPCYPPKVYGDRDFWKKVRIAFKEAQS